MPSGGIEEASADCEEVCMDEDEICICHLFSHCQNLHHLSTNFYHRASDEWAWLGLKAQGLGSASRGSGLSNVKLEPL